MSTSEGDPSNAAAEAMETSSGTKRKGELDKLEEEEERRKKETKIEEEHKAAVKYGDINEPPVWGYDSFDGLEYYTSSDEPRALPGEDEECIKMWNRDYIEYKRLLIKTKGFGGYKYLEQEARYKRIIPGVPLDRYIGNHPHITFREFFEQMVHVCLQKLNDENQAKAKAKGEEYSKVEFVGIVRGNYRGGRRAVSYITFMAREKSDGPVVEYQAKCMDIVGRKMHPMLCRPAPTT